MAKATTTKKTAKPSKEAAYKEALERIKKLGGVQGSIAAEVLK